jgi:hypothetical protein
MYDPEPVHEQHEERALAYVREALRGLRFGEITIKVQDGVIVQVERTERKRWERRREDR